MRGIDRVIAVILLVGAVGGAAAFARHSGVEPPARGVALTAPPLQHIGAGGTFFVAPRLTTPAKVAPAHRATFTQATLRRPVHAVQPQKRAQPATPKPAPAPVEAASTPGQAPPAQVQTPEPPRALAAVQPTPVQPTPVEPAKSKDHGHGGGHGKHDAPAPDAPTPTPADVPVVQPPTADSSGDAHGNGGGNDHGHGSGHDQGGGPNHSGD